MPFVRADSPPRPSWSCAEGWCGERPFFLVGIILFVAASQVYPALELDSILIFGGLVFFCSLALGYWIDYRARKRQEVEAMKRIYFGMIPVPWIFAGILLFLNREIGHFASDTNLLQPWSANLQPAGCREAVACW